MESFGNMCDNPEINKPNFSKLRSSLGCEVNYDREKYQNFCKLRDETNPFPSNLTFDYYASCTSEYNALTWEGICDLSKNNIPSNYVKSCFGCIKDIKVNINNLTAQNIIDLYKCRFNPKIDGPLVAPYMCYNVEWGRTYEFLSYPHKKSLIVFLEQNKDRIIQVGSQEVSISYTSFEGRKRNYHYNIISGLIQTAKELGFDMNSIPWEMVFEQYQAKINDYVNLGKKTVDKVFFIGTKDDLAFSRASMQTIFGSFSSNEPMTSYLEKSGIEKGSIIASLESYMQNNPNKKVVLYMGLHGSSDGFTMFDGRFFSKEEFDRFIQLSQKYDFTMFIDGCYVGNRFNSNNKSRVITTTNSEMGTISDTGKLIEIYNQTNSKLTFEEFMTLYYLKGNSGALEINSITKKGDKIKVS